MRHVWCFFFPVRGFGGVWFCNVKGIFCSAGVVHGPESLETRYDKRVYKIMHSLEKMDRKVVMVVVGFFFPFLSSSSSFSHNTSMPDNSMKLIVRRFKTDKRKYFITQGIINLWNLLPQAAVLVAGLRPNPMRQGECILRHKISGRPKRTWGSLELVYQTRLRGEAGPDAH